MSSTFHFENLSIDSGVLRVVGGTPLDPTHRLGVPSLLGLQEPYEGLVIVLGFPDRAFASIREKS